MAISLLIMGLLYYWVIKVTDRKYNHVNKAKHRIIAWGSVALILLLSDNFRFMLIPLPFVLFARWYLDKKKDKKDEEESRDKQNRKKIEDYEKRRNELTTQYTSARNIYLDHFYYADRNILEHFRSESDAWLSLENTISSMQHAKQNMATFSDILEKEFGLTAIASLPSIKNLPSAESISQLQRELCAFKRKCTNAISSSKMISESAYGQTNKEYATDVKNISHDEAVSFISQCEKLLWDFSIAPMYKQSLINSTDVFSIPLLDGGSFDFDEEAAAFEIDQRRQHITALFNVDVEKIIKCIWFFALETPFSVQSYQNAKKVFLHFFRQKSCDDIIIADLYSRFKLGGEEAIREDIKQLVEKHPQNDQLLTLIASSLMWMKAYQCENVILQHMLSSSLNMSMACQQRLNILTNSVGETAECLDVSITSNELYFDVSSLAWKNDDYSRLFDTLAFRGKSLTYALAIRDEDKELTMPDGVAAPSTEQILEKIKTIFAEEYGESTACRIANSIAVSGGCEETLKSILVYSTDCAQMGILIHLTKIGKKLTIKLYTLFLPTGNDLAEQKQQTLSLFNKLTPLTTSWERSLKDTLLVALQQLLNEKLQFNPISGSGNSPLF